MSVAVPDQLQPQADQPAPDAPKRTAIKLAGQPKLLTSMKSNPQGDWTISDVETLCGAVGLVFTNPTGGSHYKVSSPILEGILTVPFNRPIKPVYIRKLVSLARTHLAVMAEDQDNG